MKRMLRMELLGLLAMGLLVSCGKDKDDGVKIELVYVEGGTFEMGDEEYGGSRPVRTIKLDSYYIGKYEVTQGQWKAVMGTTMEEQRDKVDPEEGIFGKGDNYPMYYVSWEEAQEFCSRLSEKTGKKYVLPTEAMWEYAARGGVHKTGTKYSGSNDIEEVAWYYGNSYEDLEEVDPDYGTHRVGTKKANALGLYDMSGNVAEWCSDWYGTYDESDTENPQGPAEGDDRVIRGGGWIGSAITIDRCRVSSRSYGNPGNRYRTLGFRVAVLL